METNSTVAAPQVLNVTTERDFTFWTTPSTERDALTVNCAPTITPGGLFYQIVTL